MSVDRSVAGERLAHTLAQITDRTGTVVVGIPKGGALVGATVALGLGVAYECVPVCRIGVPCFPELTLGAIDPDGFATVDPHTQLTRYELTRSRGELAQHLRSETDRCRGGREFVDLEGRNVIVVDDMAETYLVAQSAAEYMRRHGASRVVFASPVGSDDAMPRLRELYDDVVVGRVVPRTAVLSFYSGELPSEEEIHECMGRAWDASPAAG
ncbi:MAG: hypothetical protein HGA39_07415 [Coriobacteriia bacterium]|nr:hypothetical protein [Coriobacteriia bacterium]